MKLRATAIWTLLVVAATIGVLRLRFDTEILNLLPGKLAVAQGLRIHQQHFSNARELVIALEAPSAEQAEQAARTVAAVLRARTNAVAHITWQPPWTEDPVQSAELIAFLWLNQPPAVFGEWTNRLSATNVTNVVNRAREELTSSFSPGEIGMRGYDPYGFMTLPSSVAAAAPGLGTGDELFSAPDGLFRLIFVEAKTDIVSYRACRDWLVEIKTAVSDAMTRGEISREIKLAYTGRPVFVTEIAGGMESDMSGSAGGTLVVIAVLFWLTHRRIRPLLWLLLWLLITLAGTAAAGGLALGKLNVVSMGFAAILLGLAEDFGIVIYQESRSHPELNVRELRAAVAPGIIWSAITTSGAFLLLNLSALPGLGQLGTLIAIGISVAAAGMLYGYLPLVLRHRSDADRSPREEGCLLLFRSQRVLPASFTWLVTLTLLIASASLLMVYGFRFDRSPNVLRPRNSEAISTLEQIRSRFSLGHDPLWLVVRGTNESQVSQRLEVARRALDTLTQTGLVTSYTLPQTLWPNVQNQSENYRAVRVLLERGDLLKNAALGVGFTDASLALTKNILGFWEQALAKTNVFWPGNRASEWILEKVIARGGNEMLALGMVEASTNAGALKQLGDRWPDDLQREGVILSGWELLGSTVFNLVARELPRVLVPIALLVIVSLWFAFRIVTEVLLSVATLIFTGLLLGAAMHVLGWSWNLLNMMAVPLLLGMGVDFSIHIQLALRRYNGDRLAVRKAVGRALLLAGSTTIVGFASLSFSTNSGLASLGKVCALGIALALLTAVYLLPVWWKSAQRKSSAQS